MKLGRKTKVFDYERIEIRAFINKNIFDEAKKVVKEQTSLDLPNTQVFSFALNEFIKNHYKYKKWKYNNGVEQENEQQI